MADGVLISDWLTLGQGKPALDGVRLPSLYPFGETQSHWISGACGILPRARVYDTIRRWT